MHRAVNREIEHAAEDFGEHGGDTIEVLCECGQPGCKSLLSLTIGDYDRVHGQRDRFVVALGHVDAELERVVEEAESRRRSSSPPGPVRLAPRRPTKASISS